MSEWKTIKAEEFCSTVTDGTHDSPKAKETGHFLITSKHLSPYAIDFSSAKKISEEDYQKIVKRSPVEQWDILFSMIGTIGITYLEKNSDIDYACKNMGIFKFNGNMEKAYWLYYYLQTPQAKEYILGHLRGTTQQYLPLGSLRDFPIQVPPTKIRNNITSILQTIDDRIAINTKINDNLEQQAQAIFENWLAGCDKEITIGELCENILDYSKCPYDEVVLVNSSDVTNGHFEHHTLSLNDNLKGHFKKRFKKWDILYSEIRPRNHHFAYCQFEPENYIASTRLMVIRNRPHMISSSLLYRYLMLNSVFEDFTLKTESRSGTFPQGRFEDLSRITVPYSSVYRQECIKEIIENIHSLIWNNDKENQRLSALRDTLLPKLMNGEIDVSAVRI